MKEHTSTMLSDELDLSQASYPDHTTPGCEGEQDQLTLLFSLAATNSDAITCQAARILAIRAMLPAMLEHWPDTSKRAVAGSFRTNIEMVLAAMDDRAMPPAFHRDLLAEVNSFLQVIE